MFRASSSLVRRTLLSVTNTSRSYPIHNTLNILHGNTFQQAVRFSTTDSKEKEDGKINGNAV
jgi:hypothetical protein